MGTEWSELVVLLALEDTASRYFLDSRLDLSLWQVVAVWLVVDTEDHCYLDSNLVPW